MTTTYTYYANGLRASKTANSATTSFIWDDGNLVVEKAPDAAAWNRMYVYGADGLSYRADSTTEIYTYNVNYRGDVIAVMGTDKARMAEYVFDPYGNIQESNISMGFSDNFGYRGQYHDTESGYIYLRNRYLDPSTGRFITEDPIKDGNNWFAYCEGNPIKYTDLWGLASYIFYLPEFEEDAMDNKDELIKSGVQENDIIMIPLNSEEDFINGWNNMGYIIDENGEKHTTDIDHVLIDTHGNPWEMTNGKSNEEKWNINRRQIPNLLEDKSLNGNVLLFTCNGGHLDYANDNLASELADKINGAPLIASDGAVDGLHNGLYKSVNPQSENTIQSFDFYVKAGNGVLDREHEGWVVYREIDEHITTRVIGAESKAIVVWDAIRLTY